MSGQGAPTRSDTSLVGTPTGTRHQPPTPGPATAAPLVYSGWRKGAPLDTAAARMRYWKLDREKTTVFS